MLMDKNNMIIAEQRASIARDIEYLRVMTESSFIADRFLLLDRFDETYNESVDIMENKDIMDHLTADGDEGREEEIGRILGSSSDISFDEMIGIQQDIGSAYEAAFMEDVFFEGVNMDYRRSKKIIDKQVKPLIKEMKKELADGNYTKAKQYLTRAKKKFALAKELFDSTDRSLDSDTIKTTVISIFYDGLLESLKIIALSILTLPIAGLGGYIMGLYSNIEQMVGIVKQGAEDIKKDKLSPRTLNFVRNRAKLSFDTMEKVFDKTEDLIKAMEKEGKKVKTESMDENTTTSGATTKADNTLDKTIKDVEKSSNNKTTEPKENDSALMTEDDIIEEMFDDIFDDDGVYLEGVNTDYLKSKKIISKQVKPLIKEMKKAIKEGDYKKARKSLTRAQKEFDIAREAFNAADRQIDSDTIKSTIISIFYDGLLQGLKALALSFLTFPIAGVGGSIYLLYSNIEQLVGIVKQGVEDIKKNDVSPKTLNYVRNRVKLSFDSMDKIFKKSEELIDAMEKENKNVKNESFDDIDSDDDVFEEGANKDLYDIRNKYIKPATKKLKSAKQMIKDGKKDQAVKLLQDVIKDMEAVKKVVKTIDDTSTEKLIGSLLVSWKSLVSMIISIIAMFTGFEVMDISFKAGAALAGTGYAAFVGSMFASSSDMQKAKDGAEKLLDKKMDNEGWQKALTESYNAYRTATYQMADDVINISKKLISDIKDGTNLDKIEALRNK